jgi:hypothetical protein
LQFFFFSFFFIFIANGPGGWRKGEGGVFMAVHGKLSKPPLPSQCALSTHTQTDPPLLRHV